MAQFFSEDSKISYYLLPSTFIAVINILLYSIFLYVFRFTDMNASAAAFTGAIVAGLVFLWPYSKKRNLHFFSVSTFLFALGWIGCAVAVFFALFFWPALFGHALSFLMYAILSLVLIPINLTWRWMWEQWPELVRYAVGGFFTFLVSYGTYFIFTRMLTMYTMVAQILSWILAVIFGFFINKYWVFENKSTGIKAWMEEFVNFVAGRLITSALFEFGLFALLVYVFGIYDMVAKMIGLVLVVIANYFWSRFLTFNNKSPIKLDKKKQKKEKRSKSSSEPVVEKSPHSETSPISEETTKEDSSINNELS